MLSDVNVYSVICIVCLCLLYPSKALFYIDAATHYIFLCAFVMQCESSCFCIPCPSVLVTLCIWHKFDLSPGAFLYLDTAAWMWFMFASACPNCGSGISLAMLIYAKSYAKAWQDRHKSRLTVMSKACRLT